MAGVNKEEFTLRMLIYKCIVWLLSTVQTT